MKLAFECFADAPMGVDFGFLQATALVVAPNNDGRPIYLRPTTEMRRSVSKAHPILVEAGNAVVVDCQSNIFFY
jgi:hypothetical protein